MLLSSSNSMANLGSTMAQCFGPLGMDKLIVTAVGSLVITKEGSRMMDAMKFEPGIPSIVSQTCRSFGAHTGDGTTSLALMLSTGIQACLEELDEPAGSLPSGRAASMNQILLARGLERVGKWCTDVALHDVLHKISSKIICSDPRARGILENLLLTSFTGCLSPEVGQHLTHLVMEIFSSETWDRGHCPCSLTDFKPQMISVQGGSVLDSCCVDGLILNRPFPKEFPCREVENTQFLLLQCPLERESDKDAILMQKKASAKSEIRLNTENLTEKLALLQEKEIGVVVCTFQASEIALEMFANAGILLLSGVEDESVEDICRIAETEVLYDSRPETIAYAGTSHLTFCKQVRAGRQSFVHLGFESNQKSLILKSLNQELSTLYRRQINRAAKLLMCCTEPCCTQVGSKHRISVVPGCGSVSLAVLKEVEQKIDEIRHGNPDEFCCLSASQVLKGLRVLESMAWIVPGCLARSCMKETEKARTRCATTTCRGLSTSKCSHVMASLQEIFIGP